MARVSCKHCGCHRSFTSKAAMLQHFTDSHACTATTHNHAATQHQVRSCASVAMITGADHRLIRLHECHTCGRSFDTKPALEQHGRDTGHGLHRIPAAVQVSSPQLQQTLASIMNDLLSDRLMAALLISGTPSNPSTATSGRAHDQKGDQIHDEEIMMNVKMKTVSCDDCGRSFNSFEALHQHQWDSPSHTRVSRCRMPPLGSNVRQCSQCVEAFRGAYELEQHFICAHPLTEITVNTADERSTEIWMHVATKFKMAWKLKGLVTDPPPVHQVRYIFKVNNMGWRRRKYEEYRAELKKQMTQIRQLEPEEEGVLDVRRRVLKDGNELQRYHGSTVKCDLLGRLQSTDHRDDDLLCSIEGCGLCGILEEGFRTAKCRARFQRFGRGIYVSATSSKAHGYVRMNAGSHQQLRVMLVTKVLAGRMHRSTGNLTHLTSPPPNFHSVQGVPGPVLNYDELVLYDDRAILPDYIIFYSLRPDGAPLG